LLLLNQLFQQDGILHIGASNGAVDLMSKM